MPLPMRRAIIAAAALLPLCGPARSQGSANPFNTDPARDWIEAERRMNERSDPDALDAYLAHLEQTSRGRPVPGFLSDPRLRPAWRSQACGRGLGLHGFFYVFTNTHGCTPQGMAELRDRVRRRAAPQMEPPQQGR